MNNKSEAIRIPKRRTRTYFDSGIYNVHPTHESVGLKVHPTYESVVHIPIKNTDTDTKKLKLNHKCLKESN